MSNEWIARVHFGPAQLRARAINAEPWEPMPGMIKKQCVWCRYYFATRTDTLICADCSLVPREDVDA